MQVPSKEGDALEIQPKEQDLFEPTVLHPGTRGAKLLSHRFQELTALAASPLFPQIAAIQGNFKSNQFAKWSYGKGLVLG